jgi:hypothetical protein
MTKTPRFSQLSASRQALVRLCQDINFGQILCLHVKSAEPIWDPAPTVLWEVKLNIEETPRPEADLPDFKLSAEIRRLVQSLDRLREGLIEKIDIREGIPRRIVLSSPLKSIEVRPGLSET